MNEREMREAEAYIRDFHLPQRLGSFPPELLTDAGLDQLCTGACQHAKTMFTGMGYLDYAFLVYCRRDPTGAAPGNAVYVTSTRNGCDSLRHKDTLAGLVHLLVEHGNAGAVVMLSEVWTVSASSEAEQKEVRAWQRKHGGIHNHPNRIESLAVMVEHLSGMRQYLARITEHADPIGGDKPQRVLGPWIEQPRASEVSGRFTHMLKVAPATAEQN